MKRRTVRPGQAEASADPARIIVILTGAAVAVGLAGAWVWQRQHGSGTAGDSTAAVTAEVVHGALTFQQDIAPLIYNRCSACHHPGEAAPFSLLNYKDVARHAKQVVEVTSRRIMPPWLPEPGYNDFVGARSLKEEEIQRIRHWVEQGAPEGPPENAPPAPRWREGWQLGQPDLILKLDQSYTVPAEGRDIYRNFVLPIPQAAARWVRAVEFRPGNARAIHHAFMFIDPTPESRRRDAEDEEAGFPGLHTPPTAQTPPGQFLSWQPGMLPTAGPNDLSWRLETNSDLVLKLHLRPSGKPERLAPEVAFYFTDQPPRATAYKFGFINLTLDIPAGAAAHVVRDDYTLPSDVDVLRVLPHAHYLGRRMEAFATLPDGTTRWLLRIPNWDFNWQGDYQYTSPVFLPKGSRISMVYTYDNSAANAVNPNQPPRRVKYGLSSSDEMAELWFQVIPRGREALQTLERDRLPRDCTNSVLYNTHLLALDSRNARAHAELGRARMALGQYAEALPHLQTAVQLAPDQGEFHYSLGLYHRVQRQLTEASRSFREAIRLNPDNAKAHGNLALVLLEENNPDEARPHLEAALRLNPTDDIARAALAQLNRTPPPEK